MFDHFWDLDNLSKMVRQTKKILWNIGPILGFWDYVTGMGCQHIGFSHV
jgi:hypothetical protein